MSKTRATGVFTITTVIDGENAIRLDLSNEMDMVQTDSALKVTTARTVETIARLYDGAGEVDISGTTLTVSGLGGLTCNQSPEGTGKKGRRLSIAFAVGTTIAAAYDIVVGHSLSHNGTSLPLSAELTIAASKGQPVFQLKPSYSALPCTRNAETNTLGNPPALSLRVVKVDGQSSDEKEATGSNLTALGVIIRYDKSSMPTSATGGTAWPGGNSLQALNTDSNVHIAMFSSSGLLLDRETIPVLKDGEHGDGIVSITRTYGISASSTTADESTAPADISSWAASSPAVTDKKPYLWVKEVTDYKYKADTTRYYYIGKKGDNGIDAQDCEWAYIRTKTNVAPVISDDSAYTDHNGNNYTKDDHLPKVVAGTGGLLADIESDNSGSASKKYECTDDPKGVDDTYKYEWEIKRTKGSSDTYGSRSWQPYSGTMTLHNNLAESVFQIDLDNEEDQFGTDSDSKVLVQQVRSTGVQLYYGTVAQQLNANNATVKGITAVLKYSDDDTDVPTAVAEVTKAMRSTTDYTQGIVEVTVKTGTFAKSGMYALVTATCARGSKTARFTLTKLMSGAKGDNPVIYQLAPTQKSFSFSRAADNSLTPNSRSSQINVAKTEGNTTTVISTAQTGITYKWGWDTDSTAQASGLAVGTSISVSKTDAASHSSVWVELSTGDRETLPIVKDGTHGDDAQYIYLKGTATDATTLGKLINCAVKINGGNDQSKHQRGLNLVTVNRQTLAVVESINYDTYGEATGVSGASGITDLIAKLNALDDTVFVCLVSYDAVGWSTALITALQNYGLSNIPYTSYGRYPFLFIGYKGLGIGNGLMRMRNKGPYTDVVELSVYIANGALSTNDPMGIRSADVYYAVSPIGPNTQGNVPADNLFYTNFPTTLLAGNYVWEATMITYTNDTTELTGKVCLGPTTDYLSGTEVYAVSDSNTTPPDDSQFSTTYTKTKGKYLWSATRVQYTDNSYGYLNKKCIGYWGEDGKSITKKSEGVNYQVADSGTTIPTGTWYDTKQAAVNAYNQAHGISGSEWAKNTYMWTRTIITWTNGVTDFTTTLYSAERNPNDGDAGMSIVIDSQSVQYSKQSAGNLDPATLTYGSYPSSLSKGDWLYSKTTVVYKTSKGAAAGTTVSYSVSYIGTDGDNGVGISGITEHYKASANSTGETTPSGVSPTDWGTNPTPSNPAWDADHPYLWNYEKIAKVDKNGNTTYERTTASVIAIFTKNGDAGKGVDSITNYYAISSKSSGVTKDSGLNQDESWTTSVQVPTASKPYLWNYEMITWLNYGSGSQYTYTAAHVIGHFGKDGEDKVSATVSPDKISIPCNADGSVTSAVTVALAFTLKHGTTSLQNPTISATCPTGVSFNTSTNELTISTSATASGMAAGATFTLSKTEGGKTYTDTVTVALIGAAKGATGEGVPGKTGRFYWYAGLSSALRDNVQFVATEYQAPYVNTGTNDNPTLWAFVGSNGTHYFPSSNSDYTPANGWELMNTQNKFLVSEAVFSGYAHLGSFIINKDWMISQYGVLVDSSGKETKVDGGGANPIVLYGNNVHSGTIIVRVQFTSSGTASITATASSEGSYDKGYVKNSGGSTLIEVSGTKSETVNQSVSSGGYIDLSYTKDPSVSGHDDKITFNISGVGYTLSLVSATSGMTYTGSSSSGGVIPSDPYTYFDPTDPMASTPPSSGYKFRPNFAVDGLTGKTYQNDAYVKGQIVAESGAIGGFNINSDKLTNTNYDASVSIQDAYGNQVSRIGKEAKDGMTNQSCSLEAQSRGTGTYNTALYLNAEGATYNYAFHGNGNGVLNGLIFGFKTKVYTVSGSGDTTQQLILTDGATFVLQGSKTSGWANFKVPTLDNVKLSLGLKTSDTVPFAIEINFINHSSYDNVKLLFYNSSRTDLPKWYNYNFDGTADEMQLAKGDFAKFLLTFDGYNYRANRIIHHEDGWG